jgi:hypothetical protein
MHQDGTSFSRCCRGPEKRTVLSDHVTLVAKTLDHACDRNVGNRGSYLPASEDDEHNFVLPGLLAELPGQSVTEATWRADRAGIFDFVCTIPAHTPETYGQIVVLPALVGARFNGSAAVASHR